MEWAILNRVIAAIVAAVVLATASPLAAQTVRADRLRLATGPCTVLSGSGSPEGVVTGVVCDTYIRTDTGDIYTKQSGTGNTGWASVGLPAGSTTGTVLADVGSGPVWSDSPVVDQINATTRVLTPLWTSGGNVEISPNDGDPGGDVLPGLAYSYDMGAIDRKWLTIHGGELWVGTLVAQDTLATIGGRIIVAPTTTLAEAHDTGATWLTVKEQVFASGDIVVLESGGQVEWISINSAGGSHALGWQYGSITRNLDGSGLNSWNAGTAVVSTGTTGDGYIDLTALSGLLPGTTVGPSIVFNVRTGGTYTNIEPRCAMGNLNGYYGYSSDTFGMACGEAAGAWVKVDATNGVRLGYDTETKVEIDGSGNASFAGAILAGEGAIGGWTIGDSSLTATNVGLYSDGFVADTATDFNGTSSVAASAFSSAVPAALTMGIWANADNTTASVVAAVGRNSYGGWTIYQSGGNWSASFPGVGAFGSAAVSTGTWQHLVLRRTGGTWTLFVNGVSAGTSTGTPGAPATDSYKSVGAIRNVGNTAYELFFNGKLAHFFYAAEALTDAQIANLYNGGPGGAGYAPHLFASGYVGQSPLFQYYPLIDEDPLSIWQLGLDTFTATATSSTAGPNVAMEAARVQAGTTTNLAGLTGTYSSSDVGLFVGSSWATRFTAPFRVTAAGALTATGATISGALTATSGNITAALQADSITSAMIQAGTIVASDIAAGTITATQIATGTITATQIAASTITADRLSVSSLSAINADLGTVTAGTITGVEINFDGGTLNDSDGLSFDNASGDGDFVRSVSWASGAVINGQSSILHFRNRQTTPYSQINMGNTFISFWGDTSGGDDGMDLMDVALRPQTNGILSLGTTSLRWEYLFLVETISISSFAGGGNQQVCVDNSGDLYAGTC
jgi:hypothetical protein